ncbi:MAG: hypothetical protein D6797_06795 [Bdellovibrio sp.]|nr:MAG: hypothetical protein D6797_06795 [Bdellovibrio sp.]
MGLTTLKRSDFSFSQKLLEFIVAFCLLLNFSLHAAPRPTDVLTHFSPEEESAGLLPSSEDTVNDLFALFQLGREYLKEQVQLLSEEELLEHLRQDKLVYRHPELGEVEFTDIDGVPVARIIYRPTGVVYLFVDANLVDKRSKHLSKYMARQHHLAGMSREDGKSGRDVVLVMLKGDEIFEAESLHKPSFLSKDWWTTYAQAHYKRPTFDNFLFGAFCGLVQAGSGFAVNCIASYLDSSIPLSYNVSMLNFAFGTFLGTYAKTYASWVYSGKSKVKSIFKSSVVSALYAYTLVGLQGGWASVFPIGRGENVVSTATMLPPEAVGHETWLENNTKIFLNIALNNYGKVEWAQPFKILNIEKKDTGVREFKLPVIKFNIQPREWRVPFTKKTFKIKGGRFQFPKKDTMKVKQRDINFQIKAYLPVQAFRTLDLLSIGVNSTMGVGFLFLGTHFDIKYSTMAFITSSMMVHFAVRYWANKKHKAAAEKLGLNKPLKEKPLKFFRGLKNLFKKVVSQNKEQYQGMVRRHHIRKQTKGVVREINSLSGMHFESACESLLRVSSAKK